MATISLNVSARSNQPPTLTGFVSLAVPYDTETVISLSNLTLETSPPYIDPEGDPLNSVKFTSLPATGEIRLNGTAISLNDEISATDISNNLLTYVPDTILDGYNDSETRFLVSDAGSLQFGSTQGEIIFNVASNVNRPPSSVGDGNLNINEGETVVFTRGMLTIDLNPEYTDPENDIALTLRIASLPTSGLMQLSGVNVFVGQDIPFTEIDAGNLVYINQGLNGGIDGFNFLIADAGSGEFVG